MKRYTLEGRARRRAHHWEHVAARHAAARQARATVSGRPAPYACREPTATGAALLMVLS